MWQSVLDVITLTTAMACQMLWGLIFGFTLAAIIDAVVSKAQLQKLLPDHSPSSLTKASLLGAAASSCSYAAVAMARALFPKGGDFTAAMAFQFAATNLVLELGVLLVLLMGWSFAGAEFIGGPIMIVVMALLLILLVPRSWIEAAREQAKKGLAGKMEGHANMATMEKEGNWRQRLSSAKGWTAISHYFVMNWAML